MDKKQSMKVKRQPLKVVYIGNPRMFKAKDYQEFKQIVQQFTGQNPETKSAITPKVNKKKMKDTVKEKPNFVCDPPSATSTSTNGYVNQDFIYPSFTPEEYVDQDLIYPSSSSEYVSQDLIYPSSSSEYVSQDLIYPSSSSEYVSQDLIYPTSSSDFTYPSSSSSDIAYEDSVCPSSSSEYIDPEYCILDPSSTDFLDGLFTVEMLENYRRFM